MSPSTPQLKESEYTQGMLLVRAGIAGGLTYFMLSVSIRSREEGGLRPP